MKRFAIILFIGFNVVACNKAQRQLERTQEYLFKHPEFSTGYCAEQFPDKPDSVIVKTDTVTEIIVMDSLVFNTDTLIKDSINVRYITKVVTKTIRKDSIIYRENRAEQERLQLGLLECQRNNGVTLEKNLKLEADLASWKGKAKTRWLWLMLLIGGAVAYTGFKVFKTVKGV